MPPHNVIDNRTERLVDHINRIFASTDAARFAVGYFFLSGLESIAEKLAVVKELRLLIGNAPDRRALDSLVYDVLGLTAGERDAVHEAVINLVEARLKKAGSV